MKKNNILVIGDAGLDHYICGKVSHLAQEAAIPILKVKNEYYSLGMAANVASQFVALKCNVTLVHGTRSNKTLDKLLKDKNIKTLYNKNSKNRVTIKQRTVNNNTYLSRNDYEDVIPVDVISLLKKLDLNAFDAIVLSDYGKGTIGYPQQLITYLKSKSRAFIYLDPDKNKYIGCYEGVTCIKANKSEALAITQTNNVLSALDIMINNCYFPIITQGDKPTLIVEDGGGHAINVPKVNVQDITGCGDSFLASLVVNMNRGNGLLKSVKEANKYAANKAKRFGT